MSEELQALLLMVAGHFVCDYPLQGEWLSKIKNHKIDLVGERIWPMSLLGHASIHAAMVGLVTGSLLLATLEMIVHTITDYAKCDGRIGYNTDQYIHVACKVVWAALMFAGATP